MHKIEEFLGKGYSFAIVGVSSNPDKWGRRIYEKLKENGFSAYPINPKYKKIGSNICYGSLSSLPKKPDVVITAVPPEVTYKILKECKDLAIDKVWMQPGSESKKAIDFCKEKNITAVSNLCFIVDNLGKGFED